MYNTILVAVDGSDTGRRAADRGMDVAETFDAELHVIYVVDTSRYGRPLTGTDTIVEDLEDRGRSVMADLEAQATVPVTTVIRQGRPYDEIVDYAADVDADLVVLGNRGLGGGDAEQIGSVAERVVRRAGRPVMTA